MEGALPSNPSGLWIDARGLSGCLADWLSSSVGPRHVKHKQQQTALAWALLQTRCAGLAKATIPARDPELGGERLLEAPL